jgi:DNA polymerase-1
MLTVKTEKEQKVLVLLDAHAILHRAFHALPSFTSPQGEPTGALYGFTAMLFKIIRELNPDHIAACYDLPKPTFRHVAYKGYKAQRPKMEDELAAQIARSRDILAMMHIPIYDAAGFEADDVIGTITEHVKKEKNLQVVIASGDMDTAQLVRDKDVVVYTLRKGIQDTIVYDEEEVKKRYGFTPEYLPDFKGLKGDPSDNIIGVPGIGDKGATELIQKFGKIEEIYAVIKKDENKLLEGGIKPRLLNLLKEHEEEALFSKELATIRRDAPVNFVLDHAKWLVNYDQAVAEKFFRGLGFVSLLGRMPAQLGATVAGSGIKDKKNVAEKSDSPAGEEKKKIMPVAEPRLLKRLQVMAWLLDSRRVDVALTEILDIVKANTPIEAEQKLETMLKEAKLGDFYENVEKPLIDILRDIQDHGILLDSGVLSGISERIAGDITRLEKEIWEATGEEFNINSPKQLAEVLYDKMQIKKTGGTRSTGVKVLKKLAAKNPVIEKIFNYRELTKLRSTYLEALPKLVDKEGRLHTTFNQAGTATGRFSSQNPNLQNIPIRTEIGREIRRAFIAPKGYKLLSADYSQIELRMVAILSKDKRLHQIFNSDEDIHSATAMAVFHVKKDEVTREMRRRAKVINFGILYGMGTRSLAENLGVSQVEAKIFYDAYFESFPGMRRYIEETKKFAENNGYVETLFGRRRYFPELTNRSVPEFMRGEFLRMAVNAPLQGTAADIMKIAIIRVAKRLVAEKSLAGKVYVVLQIHDELLLEVEEELVKKVAAIIREEMEAAFKDDIPLVAEAKEGANWAEMTQI